MGLVTSRFTGTKATSDLPKRELGLLERFLLVNTNVGEPHTIAYLASFPDPSTLPTLEFLQARIELLQSKWPMLWAVIKGSDGEKPFFEARSEGHWSPNDVIVSREYPQHDRTSRQYALELLEQDIRNMAKDHHQLDVKSSWRVTILTPERQRSSAGPEQEKQSLVDSLRPAYLILSTTHMYFDGMGGLYFLRALLCPPDSEILTSLRTETLSLIPRIEDTVNVKPRLGYLLPVIWRELIVPNLFPKVLQEYILPNDTWPGKDVRPPLFGVPTSLTVGAVDKEVMDNLKRWARVKGSGTLHPVLEVTYFIAMWSVLHVQRHQSQDRTFPRHGESRPSAQLSPRFKIETSTPKSERKPSLGHASSSAPYLADFECDFILDTSSKSEVHCNFWARVKRLGEHLLSTKGLQDARGTVGLLLYAPKGVNKVSSASSDRDNGLPRTPTKWEELFFGRSKSSLPFRRSVAVSNLGYVELPSEVDELLWTQASTFMTSVIMVSLSGDRAGLRWTTCFKDGVAVTKDEMERIDRLVERILIYLSKQDWTDRDDISMQSLVEECT